MSSELLRLENVHKAFGPVQALRGVDLSVAAGEVHAVIGENGAGKSTLMKILSGVYPPDEGQMFLNSIPHRPASPLDARAAGISMIYQELVLAPHLTVEENITLGIERSKAGWITSRTPQVKRVLQTLGQLDLDPQTPVHDLSIGKKQLVEIARALVADACVVVMDEPTSSLSAEDARALFRVIRRLAADGVAVIYISHFLEEVQEVCDAYTVIRDGETVATGRVSETSVTNLVEAMVGRPVEELYPHTFRQPGQTVLRVRGLRAHGGLPEDASFDVRRGERLGIFGLVGAGRSETVRALFGLQKTERGKIEVQGHSGLDVRWISPPKALSLGLDLLSENRKEEGLALNMSLLSNMTLSSLRRYVRRGFLRLNDEAEDGRRWIDNLRIKCHDVAQPASTLSGGNQQKICLARLLHRDGDILFLDEPTRGLDIGSKSEVYQLIDRLAMED
ncbi:MAG: sugar ABC transporter ATP-binding protein, partial [Rhodothermia bacterium]|nr:sugar ABC transporter ATP-binding protein [Rhodothermia bacterium]